MILSKKLSEAFNAQVNAEMWSSNLYLSMSVHFQKLGLNGFAHWMKKQAEEEMGHAHKMIDFTIDRTKSGEVVFTKSKSILLKTMKIRRIYDAETQTLLYISYSTKETTGSFKHSLSTIPLWGTAAWENRPPVPAKTI